MGLDELVDDAVLLVDELVSNAIVHAGTPITVVIAVEDDCVRFEVGDETETLPEQRVPGPDDVTGRGLQLVDRVADAGWGVEPHTGGKSVWFALSAPRHALAGGRAR